MLNDIGLIALFIAFALGAYSVFSSLYGGMKGIRKWVESARNASVLTFVFLTISVFVLVYALVNLDLSLAYVADVSSTAMSPFLRITALWGGQQGSILFWAWLMAGFVAVVMLRKWESDRVLMPYFIVTAMLTTTFFIGVTVIITNPFARLWHVPGASELITAVFQPSNAMPYIPEEGSGLNPLLRHFGMIGHPPTTYLGFTGFVIPFAFAISALVTGQSQGDDWIRTSRRWTLVAWIFLSIGLILGGRWAYDVLGWGGFWGWDPIENAMLMPWLTGTAFLHSVMMTEKRGMLKKWNMVLIILTYSLVLFGTFITRTGIVSSVHAFSKTALGPAFFVFIGFTFVGSLSLLIWRWNTLKTEHELESIVSRESAFLLQNLIFVAITFAVFWGTVFPLISELVTGTKITVGPPYYQKVTGPLFGVIVLLMGIAPLFAWRKQAIRKLGKSLLIPFVISLIIAALWGYAHRTHPGSFAGLWLTTFVLLTIVMEFWKGLRARIKSKQETLWVAFGKLVARNRRRYGGYIIHMAVIMIALGFIGDTFFKEETQGSLSVGETLTLNNYELRFNGLEIYPGSDGREVLEASTTLFKDGEAIQDLSPRRDFFVVQQQPVTIPGVYSTAAGDVYVLLVGWEEIGLTSSTFKIYINPLVNWVWIGGIVMMFGTLIAAWPSQKNLRSRSYVLKPGTPQLQPNAGD
ncbi:MAG: heme lyase CcmF/NrfE family subunit [Chloroflexi bacterium]|nr:MAG: heme lyase CcmF/NrfE family subunit [Chloroflexota bacterium]MBL1194950.1 heme lyase CcmF/NrfE family subunit [Chloroflexota bacterium]NOH12240.1 heme lyase CcmF/NrfE family subunit [Chloroflexota bacterium]